MKKLKSIVLTVILLFTLLSPAVCASGPTITVGTATGKPGDAVSVPVSLSDNPGVNSFALGFEYDDQRLVLKDVTADPALGGQFSYAKKAVWIDSADSTRDGVILYLHFEVLSDAKAGDASVTVTYDEGEIINLKEEDIPFAVVPGAVTVQETEHTHVWDEGKVTKEATDAEEGIRTFTCTVCGETKTDVIPVTPIMLGDVNNDGIISAEDARYALRAAVGLDDTGEDLDFSNPQNRCYIAANVDKEAGITSADARLILRAAVGLETLT